MNEISRTRKELSFANKKLGGRAKMGATGGKENGSMNDCNDAANDIQKSMKLVETIGIQKKVVEQENEELRSRVGEL